MDDLCTLCLCSGRTLFFIGETGFYNLYQQILNEIEVYDISIVCVRLCWECRAALRHFQRFKSQVQCCYVELLQHVQQQNSTQRSLCKEPRLQIHSVANISCPEIAIKTEAEQEDVTVEMVESVKLEHEMETHREPETFVLDLNLEGDEPENGGSVKKNSTQRSLCKEPRLQIHSVANISCPEIAIKTEAEQEDVTVEMVESVKLEHEMETHREPETFVLDLNLEGDEPENGGSVKKNSTQRSLCKEPRLQIHSVTNISCPEIAIKTEAEQEDVTVEMVESVKLEHEMETHREPETFVLDLNLEGDEPENGGSVKKTNKKKIKKKLKKKKPSVKVKRKRNDVSDSEPWLEDCAESEEVAIEGVKGEEGSGKNAAPDSRTEVEFDAGLESHDETNRSLAHVNGRAKRAPRSRETLPEKPQCVECGKMFSSRKTYRYHLNVLHKGQNHYPCPRCGKVYQWKSNLARHLRSHKARDSGELHCSACNKRFASVATYRQHLRLSRRHVLETDFSFGCDDCGKKFVNKTRLRDHIDWEHLKKIKFRCQLCNKAYKCHTSLYVHTQNVHRNKEKKDNLCHICGKSYQNTAKLKYHIIAMHTSETPYQCEKCSASFGWYSSLYRHVREVHYKMKVQPKKAKKAKKSANEMMPPLLPSQEHHPPPHPGHV